MRTVMMVDAHNTVDVTVECQVYRGVCVSSLGRIDVDTCKVLLVCEEPYHVYQVW